MLPTRRFDGPHWDGAGPWVEEGRPGGTPSIASVAAISVAPPRTAGRSTAVGAGSRVADVGVERDEDEAVAGGVVVTGASLL